MSTKEGWTEAWNNLVNTAEPRGESFCHCDLPEVASSLSVVPCFSFLQHKHFGNIPRPRHKERERVPRPLAETGSCMVLGPGLGGWLLA